MKLKNVVNLGPASLLFSCCWSLFSLTFGTFTFVVELFDAEVESVSDGGDGDETPLFLTSTLFNSTSYLSCASFHEAPDHSR